MTLSELVDRARDLLDDALGACGVVGLEGSSLENLSLRISQEHGGLGAADVDAYERLCRRGGLHWVGRLPEDDRRAFVPRGARVYLPGGKANAAGLILSRIEQNELKTREKLLELELRLAEMSEKMPPGQEA